MTAKLIPIRKSLGMRISDLQVENDGRAIRTEHRPRDGWEKTFCVTESLVNDEPSPQTTVLNEFDHKEWMW